MKVTKSPLFLVVIAAILYGTFFPQLMGCKKETITEIIKDTVIVKDTTFYDVVCPLRGTYSGTNTPNGGSPTPISYSFQDYNFAVGRITVSGPAVTFGGYRNTCDSVILSVYYTTNSDSYSLKGKFSNNRNTITGTYNNLTTLSDFGTFTISK